MGRNSKQKRHQIHFEEEEGGPLQRQKTRRIGEWLSRLSNYYVQQLSVWAFHLNKFGRRQFDEDIAYYQHINFRAKMIHFDGKSGSANFDIRLYSFLMQSGR